MFILDTQKGCYVWVGGGASPAEKKNGFRYAHVSRFTVVITICSFKSDTHIGAHRGGKGKGTGRHVPTFNFLSFSDLIKSCSEDLFDNAHKSNHCLHELFSSYVHRLESLRPRGHDLMLPACTGYLYKRSFIIRSLFEFL